MLEDLKKLKEELEQSQEYIAVEGIHGKKVIIGSEKKSLSEFQTLENTDDFIIQCEKLFEEATKMFNTNNIPYTTIQMYSKLGLLCKPDFVEYLETEFEKVKGSQENWNLDLENLDSNISLKYVPIKFKISLAGSGLEGEYSIDEYLETTETEIPQINELCSKTITGIVDIEKFINRMKELGYNFDLMFYGECSNMIDYITAIKNNQWDTHMMINANFVLEETNSLSTK